MGCRNELAAKRKAEMAESRSGAYGSWALIAIALLLFGVSIGAAQFKVPVIMTNLMAQFGMDAGASSWLMSIFTLVGFILALPTGMLAKRFGPKSMLVAAAVAMVTGSVIGAFSTNSIMLIASRGIEGVAFIFVIVCGPLAVQKYVAPEKTGSATGVWTLWGCLGSVVGGTLTPSLFSATGFAGVWLIYAACVVVFAAGVVAFVKFPGGASPVSAAAFDNAKDEGGSAGPAEKASYAEFFRPNLLLYFAGILSFNIVLMAVLSFSPAWMQGQGIDPTMSGFLSTLPMLLAIVSSPLYGALVDKLGRCKPLYLAALSVMGPCAFLMLTGTGAALWVGAIVMGLVGLGTPVMCLTSLNQVLGKPDLAAVGMGALMLVQSFGQFLGTLVPPVILGAAGDQWMALGIAVLAIGLAGVASLALCKFR